MLALERAARAFKPSKENRFGTFAAVAISNAMSRAIKKQSRVIAIPEAHYRDMAVLRQAAAELSASQDGSRPQVQQIVQRCSFTVK